MSHPWLIVVSPFLLGLAIVGAIKGWERLAKYRYERARRIRNAQMYRYGMHASRGTKDWWLS